MLALPVSRNVDFHAMVLRRTKVSPQTNAYEHIHESVLRCRPWMRLESKRPNGSCKSYLARSKISALWFRRWMVYIADVHNRRKGAEVVNWHGSANNLWSANYTCINWKVRRKNGKVGALHGAPRLRTSKCTVRHRPNVPRIDHLDVFGQKDSIQNSQSIASLHVWHKPA